MHCGPWAVEYYGPVKEIMGQGVNIEIEELVGMPKIDMLTVQVK